MQQQQMTAPVQAPKSKRLTWVFWVAFGVAITITLALVGVIVWLVRTQSTDHLYIWLGILASGAAIIPAPFILFFLFFKDWPRRTASTTPQTPVSWQAPTATIPPGLSINPSASPGSSLAAPDPGSDPPAKKPKTAWNVPYRRNPFFTGREDQLTKLHNNLMHTKAAAITQPQAISGLGGVGKTQIAVEYAFRYGKDSHEYLYVLWASAASRDALVLDFVKLAGVLNLPEKDELDQNMAVEAVKRWLEEEEHEGWLLILDNADDLAMVREFLPATEKGHILLTSRDQVAGGLAQSIEVREMDGQEGALLLLRRAKLLKPDELLENALLQERLAAEVIAKEMGGLPLALDQAGAYIEETKCSLSIYQESYQRRKVDLLKRRGGKKADHPEPVATTWSLNFEQVEKASSIGLMAADVLRLCAFLAPDDIAEEIMVEGAAELGPNLQPLAGDATLLNDALGVLLSYSLIRRNTAERTVSIHRLLQAVLQESMDEEARRQWAERTIRVINETFPPVIEETWPLCKRYIEHVQLCAIYSNKYSFTFVEISETFSEAGRYLQEQALYKQAEPLYQQALSIRQKELGNKHPSTAQSLNNLGRLYRVLGKYKQAESLLSEALSIDKLTLGQDHPNLVSDLVELARLFKDQGKYSNGMPLLQQALDLSQRQVGLEPSNTISILNYLAEFDSMQGEYQRAESNLQKVITVQKEVLGNNHPDVAISLDNLAVMYYHQEKYEQAVPLFVQALTIMQAQDKLNHLKIAKILNNLAVVYRFLEYFKKAEDLHQLAIDMTRNVLGPKHPDTADSLFSLATYFLYFRDYEQAEPLLKEALAIYREALDFEHPKIATVLNDLAGLYQSQGKLAEAEPLFERALAICEKVLGEEHPDTVRVRNNYAGLKEQLKREKERK